MQFGQTATTKHQRSTFNNGLELKMKLQYLWGLEQDGLLIMMVYHSECEKYRNPVLNHHHDVTEFCAASNCLENHGAAGTTRTTAF